MSPQQARGQPLNFQSDQFSFGSILYETVTGEKPFQRETAVQTLAAIIESEPEPISALKPDVPPALEAVVKRCHAKNPGDRYAQTRDLAQELQDLKASLSQGSISYPRPIVRSPIFSRQVWLGFLLTVIILAGVGILALALPSRLPFWSRLLLIQSERQLAVIPFTNVGNDPASQPFCDGLVEILTTKMSQLQQFHSVRVVPASEVRGEGITSVGEAQKAFGVTLAITGSMQRSGNSFRVTINLVDAKTDRQLRGQVIDTEVTDLAVLQDGVVMVVADLLGLAISPQEKEVLTAGGTTIPRAYEFYLQANGYLQRYENPESVENAVSLLQKAVEQDSNFALAHATLGEAYWRKYELTKDAQWATEARNSCNRAIRLNDKLAPAYVTLGLVDRGTGRYDEAIEMLQKALALDFLNASAYRELANVYEALGKFPEAEATYRKAIKAKPSYWAGYKDLGRLFYRSGRYALAAEQYRRVIELTPDNARGYSSLGLMYVYMKQYRDARTTLERSLAIKPNYSAYANLGRLNFSQHKYAEAAQFYERAAILNPGDYDAWHNVAAASAWAPNGQEKARAAYQRAAELAEKELQVNSRQPQLLLKLASCYSALDQPDRARELLREGVSLAPNDVPNLFEAVTIYETLGDREVALDLLRKAMRLGLSRDLVESSPNLAKLRADPRFQGLSRP